MKMGWIAPVIPFHCDLYWFPLFWAHQCRLAAAAVFRPTSPLPVANPPSRASDVDREWRFRRASHHVSGFLNLRPCVSSKGMGRRVESGTCSVVVVRSNLRTECPMVHLGRVSRKPLARAAVERASGTTKGSPRRAT